MAAENEVIAHVDGIIPVGGGSLDGVVIAVLVVVEKGIVPIACKQGSSVAEWDRVRRVVRGNRSHRVLHRRLVVDDVVGAPPPPPPAPRAPGPVFTVPLVH